MDLEGEGAVPWRSDWVVMGGKKKGRRKTKKVVSFIKLSRANKVESCHVTQRDSLKSRALPDGTTHLGVTPCRAA